MGATVTAESKTAGRDLRDALILFAAAAALAVTVVSLKPLHPFIQSNAGVLVAAGFLLLTAAAVRLRRESGREYGLSLEHWKGEIIFVLALCALIFPFYFVGFRIYWNPPSPFHLSLRIPFWTLALNHFVVVALPEEFLFRGFIQQRLGSVFTRRARFLGLTLGWHIPAAAALFALGHIVTDMNPNRLATFFPALVFGVIKERRGSLIGCVLFHALCNIFSDIVVWGFYPR
jgi:membrane protease YdiL (CAAX protease family)